MFNMAFATWWGLVHIYQVAAWPSVFWLCYYFLYVRFRLSHFSSRALESAFIYFFHFFFPFFEKSLPCSCLCLLCLELPLGKYGVFLPLSPSSLTFRNFSHGSHIPWAPWPSVWRVYLGWALAVSWESRGAPTSVLTLVWVVCLYPTVTFLSVSFVEKMIHVGTVKVNFPQAFFWEFSQLLWFSEGYSPTLDIQDSLVDPLYDETETSTVLGDFSEWQPRCSCSQEKGFVGQSTGLVGGTFFWLMWSGAI